MEALHIDPAEDRPDARLRRAIRASNQDPIPRDLIVQVCLGADGSHGVLQRLYREIEIIATLLARDRVVTGLHLVEGTRTPMNPLDRDDLLQALAQHFALTSDVLAAIDSAVVCGAPPEKFDILGLGPGATSRFGGSQFKSFANATAYGQALDAGRLPTIEQQLDGKAT